MNTDRAGSSPVAVGYRPRIRIPDMKRRSHAIRRRLVGSNLNHRSSHLFTSESVTMGHPDKVADQISDSILDSLLEKDKYARVACETLVTTGLIVIAGEVTIHNDEALKALNAAEDTARQAVRSIGYDDPAIGFDYRSCAVLRAIH